MPKNVVIDTMHVSDRIYDFTKYYVDSYKDNGLKGITDDVPGYDSKGKMSLSQTVKLLGAVSAIKSVQGQRNIFQRFFSWITGKTKREDDAIRDIDNVFKKHDLNVSSKDYKHRGLGAVSNKIATLAVNDKIHMFDDESKDMASLDEEECKLVDLSKEFENSKDIEKTKSLYENSKDLKKEIDDLNIEQSL